MFVLEKPMRDKNMEKNTYTTFPNTLFPNSEVISKLL